MKLKKMVLWGMLMIIFGCAPLEPARIEEGLYINPLYHFSVRVPYGWEVTETIPKIIEERLSFLTNQKIKATFSDLDNKGFILVMAEITDTGWVDFKMFSEKFTTALDNYYAKEQEIFKGRKTINYHRYQVYQDDIDTCQKQCLAAKVDFGTGDLTVTGYNIIYEGNGMLYTTSLILVTRQEYSERNLDDFTAVIESFQRI